MSGRSGLGFERPVLFGRSLAESLRMYGLGPDALRGRRILDCPGGPGSLAAEVAALGVEIVACDPAYAMDDATLAAGCREDLARTMAAIREEPGHFAYDFESYEAERRAALDRFLADLRPGRSAGRYLPASLPALPFPDRSFDLVLSGHLLFTYAPTDTGGLSSHANFDLAFHEASLRELVRVSRHEVRVFPVSRILQSRREHPWLTPLRESLAASGVRSEVRPVDYEPGPDGPSLLLTLVPPPG